MPKLSGVIETALYVDDLDRARTFYEKVLGLEALTADSRFVAYDVGGRSVLLLFRRGSTPEGSQHRTRSLRPARESSARSSADAC